MKQCVTRSKIKSNTSTTLVRHKRHKCNMSETEATKVRHEFDTSATRVQNFNFDNRTRENIFSHPYMSYLANERLQGEEQFNFKN